MVKKLGKGVSPAFVFGVVCAGLLVFACSCGSLRADSPDDEVDALGPNAACYVCHVGFVREKISKVHLGEDVTCIDCHADIKEVPHEEQLKRPDCSQCHEDIGEEYLTSLHGQALVKGKEYAPYCWDCHDKHYVYSQDDSLSKTYPANLPGTCAKCHSDPAVAKKYHIAIANPTEAYTQSIHYRAFADKGLTATAKCSDCHGAHNLQSAMNPESMVHRLKIHETCGNCHEEVSQAYIESIHGKGLLAGVRDAPTCSDCHSEHAIHELADFWDSHEVTDFDTELEEVKKPVFINDSESNSISVTINASEFPLLKRIAKQMGKNESELVSEWVHHKIHECM